MSTLFSKVDKVHVNYETEFICSIGLNICELDSNIKKVKLFNQIPSYIEFVLPVMQNNDEKITYKKENQETVIEIEIKNIDRKAMSRLYELRCKFKYSQYAPSCNSFENITSLYIDDKLICTATSEKVNLVINPNFTLTMLKIVPQSDVACGEPVIWEVKLENIGDKGGAISDVVITGIFSDQLELITTYNIIGKDMSNNQYSDNRVNGIKALYRGNSFTFTIPPEISYRGTDYRFYIIARIKKDIGINTQISNKLSWTVNGVEKSPPVDTITVTNMIQQINPFLNTPSYVSQNDKINCTLQIENAGNLDVADVDVEIFVSNDIIPNKLKTGVVGIDSINWLYKSEYELFFMTNKDNTQSLGKFYTDKSSVVDFNDIKLRQDEKIIKIYWKLLSLPIGASYIKCPQIDGIVCSSAKDIISNHLHITYKDTKGINIRIHKQKHCIVNMYSELYPQLINIKSPDSIHPGSIMRYGIHINCDNSRVINPIISNFLHEDVEYIGNETYRYYNYFDDKIIDSTEPVNNDNTYFPIPCLIHNYNNTKRDLLKYSYENDDIFILNQNDYLEIEFDVILKQKVSSTVEGEIYMGNKGNLGIVNKNVNVFNDIIDVDNDSIYNEKIAVLQLKSKNISLLPQIETMLDILEIDERPIMDSPNDTMTINYHQAVKYRITVANTGHANITNINIVNILPSIDDKSILDDTVARNSEFDMNIRGNIEINVYPREKTSPTFTVEYSKSISPSRFNVKGLDDWSIIRPYDDIEIKAFRIIQNSIPLLPGKRIEITYELVPSYYCKYNQIAYNSFALSADSDTNTFEQFMLLEPKMIGLKLVKLLKRSNISGYVFLDEDENGIFDDDEYGIDNISVYLYNLRGNFVASTISGINKYDKHGYYEFSEVIPGIYYVMIKVKRGYEITRQLLNPMLKGSRVDNKKGTTELMNLISPKVIDDIYIGLTKKRHKVCNSNWFKKTKNI